MSKGSPTESGVSYQGPLTKTTPFALVLENQGARLQTEALNYGRTSTFYPQSLASVYKQIKSPPIRYLAAKVEHTTTHQNPNNVRMEKRRRWPGNM